VVFGQDKALLAASVKMACRARSADKPIGAFLFSVSRVSVSTER
jgi:hypothetical protein